MLEFRDFFLLMYLLFGLGIFFGRLCSGGNVRVSFKNIVIGIPYGVIVGLFVTITWPFYLAAMISLKLNQ